MRGRQTGWNGTLLERFEQKYIPEPNSGCWLWFGAIGGRDERGSIGIGYDDNGEYIKGYAHRVSWELYRGPIPEGMRVLHRCDVPSCVNPEHLWIGTQDDNMKDCAKKGRIVCVGLKGEEIGNSKLTEAAVLEIRTKKLKREEYADKFGIHPVSVNAIQRRASWKHI